MKIELKFQVTLSKESLLNLIKDIINAIIYGNVADRTYNVSSSI